MGRTAELLERLETADGTRRAVRRSGRPARSPWKRLPEEETSEIRRAQTIGRTLGLALSVLALIVITVWLINVLSYAQPAR